MGFAFKAAIAQLAARRSHNPKVVSSILTGRISTNRQYVAFVATNEEYFAFGRGISQTGWARQFRTRSTHLTRNAVSEDRTHDLRIMRPTRCQLRYSRLLNAPTQTRAKRCNQNSCENIRRRSTCACSTRVCAGKQFYY